MKLPLGPRTQRVLERLGINAKQFRLLTDLFAYLSETGEATAELGRNQAALKAGAFVSTGISLVLAVALAAGGASPGTYLAVFIGFTAVFVVPSILSEAGNTLVNPTEGTILAHQPVNGATYTAAKLTHLLRMVAYYVLSMNGLPAFIGLWMDGARWYYPAVHLSIAMAGGLIATLSCCGLFGWLLRTIPAKRLKMAIQFVTAMPVFFFSFGQNLLRRIHISQWIPASRPLQVAIALTFTLAIGAATWHGLRSLSADYLLRVASFRHSGPVTASKRRGGWMGRLTARFFGGQTARAGFTFATRMMLRDWQFRRQMSMLIFVPVLGIAGAAKRGLSTDPFSSEFAVIHLLPHVLGALLFLICAAMPYGNDYKGSWALAIAPASSLYGFARGVHASLWLPLIAIPHLLLLPVLMFMWSPAHAVLFIAFSLAIVSLWLAADLCVLTTTPFCSQIQPSGSFYILPLMFAGVLVTAVAAALQHFLLFRSPVATATVTLLACAGAVFATRASVMRLAANIRFDLANKAGETGSLYKEIA